MCVDFLTSAVISIILSVEAGATKNDLAPDVVLSLVHVVVGIERGREVLAAGEGCVERLLDTVDVLVPKVSGGGALDERGHALAGVRRVVLGLASGMGEVPAVPPREFVEP